MWSHRSGWIPRQEGRAGPQFKWILPNPPPHLDGAGVQSQSGCPRHRARSWAGTQAVWFMVWHLDLRFGRPLGLTCRNGCSQEGHHILQARTLPFACKCLAQVPSASDSVSWLKTFAVFIQERNTQDRDGDGEVRREARRNATLVGGACTPDSQLSEVCPISTAGIAAEPNPWTGQSGLHTWVPRKAQVPAQAPLAQGTRAGTGM